MFCLNVVIIVIQFTLESGMLTSRGDSVGKSAKVLIGH